MKYAFHISKTSLMISRVNKRKKISVNTIPSNLIVNHPVINNEIVDLLYSCVSCKERYYLATCSPLFH